jgi:hypothetical protein
MPGAHSASAVQWAGAQPNTSVVVHGSGAGQDSPAAHGGVEAQLPEAPTTVHSNPTPHAGPVPQPGSGATMALDSELNKNTAEAANVAGRKRSWVMSKFSSMGAGWARAWRARRRVTLGSAASVPGVRRAHQMNLLFNFKHLHCATLSQRWHKGGQASRGFGKGQAL